MGFQITSPSIARLSIDNPERIRLSGIRPTSPDQLDQEWDKMQTTGTTTLTLPAASNREACSFKLGQLFGDHVAITCRHDQEPSDAAMALLWKFSGSTAISMVSQTRPAHTLKYIPDELSFSHSTRPVDACSQFALQPSGIDIRHLARASRPHTTVALVGRDAEDIARKTALLFNLRPDLNIFGCTPDLPGGPQQIHESAVGVDAFHRIANVQAGGSGFLAAPLTRRDALWINQLTGRATRPGEVIFAPQAAHGIDRALFTRWWQVQPDVVCRRLDAAVRPNPELLPVELACPPTPGGAPGLKTTRQAIRRLGSTVVFGSTGNIGSAITEALGGKVPLTTVSRRFDTVPHRHLGSPLHPVVQASAVPPGTDIKTAFLTASVPWRRCPKTQRIIFDRAALLEDNLTGILIPQLRTLPESTRVLQIITNPSSELAYAAWLLRPDLEHAISAHVGTDIVRQRAHVKNPNDTDSWFTFGPHSPAQVNVDLADGSIDQQVPILGKILNDEAGDRSVTDPTGLSSIVEAARLHSHLPGCYGLPLTANEARQLSVFMRDEAGRPIAVSEGIAPTLPRDENRRIRWELLKKALSVDEFAQRAHAALAEMEEGRNTVLDCLARYAAQQLPGVDCVDPQWVLDNREKLLKL